VVSVADPYSRNLLVDFLDRSSAVSLVFSLGGVRLSPLGTSATVWPIVQPWIMDAPVPLCPQIPHDLPGLELGPPRWEASNYPHCPDHVFLQ
jgi:hypothetical protein